VQTNRSDRERAAQIVRDAGGRIVGRTRMQKIAFLLELTGLGEGFHFEYKHYGPYSDELTKAIRAAAAFGLVNVDEQQTSWGGWYSTYSAADQRGKLSLKEPVSLAMEAAKLDPVELELAATAAYLKIFEGYDDPWSETARRKPEKAANGRLESAKAAYRQLMSIEAPRRLPNIV